MKKIITLIIFLVALAVVYFGFLQSYFVQETIQEVTFSQEELDNLEHFELVNFEEINIDSVHSYDKDKYAFRGSSLIDIDNDGVDEIWLSGGKDQIDSMFKYMDGEFVDISEETEINKHTGVSAGAVSLDIDQDNDVDLIIAKSDGVNLVTNEDGVFTESRIDFELGKEAMPMSVAAGDINKDGYVDLYISTFKITSKFQLATFEDFNNYSDNTMLLNNGDNTFTDITEEAGLSFEKNTFQAVFTDFNNDGWQDLAIATNTEMVYVYENLKDGTFDRKAPLTDYAFWMGISVADYDNDGLQDIFVTNIGNTIPFNTARGDLMEGKALDSEWRLLRNLGNFEFEDTTEQTGLLGYEFAWGALFEDINLDGLLDLTVVENYIKWPAHKLNKLPGRVFLQKKGQFTAVTESINAENSYFGTSPLFSDFNGDGYSDLVYVNLDGPVRALLNSGGNNNYIRLEVNDDVASLGLMAELFYTNGDSVLLHRIAGQSLLADTQSDLVFGLGKRTDLDRIELSWPNGDVDILDDLEVNTVIDI